MGILPRVYRLVQQLRALNTENLAASERFVLEMYAGPCIETAFEQRLTARSEAEVNCVTAESYLDFIRRQRALQVSMQAQAEEAWRVFGDELSLAS